jgi:aldehyde dehydrogenase (NAD+)
MTTSASSELLPTPAAPFQTRLLFDNCWIESESGETIATINPSTGETICEVAAAGVADVDKAVCAARRAFEHGPWRKLHASERGLLLNRLADLIEKHADDLARLESLDNGKPVSVARRVDVAKSIACYR